MYRRYLTKICDQVVALLSPEHSTAIVWSDQNSDTESVDIEACESDRLFTFEVAEMNEQEEKMVARPGFQVLPFVFPRCPASD
jgi:acetyl-CoA carboxylase alpha subunit